jgi:hypothetical protein
VASGEVGALVGGIAGAIIGVAVGVMQTIMICKEKIWQLLTKKQALTTYSMKFDYYLIVAIETAKLISNQTYRTYYCTNKKS